MIAGQGTPDQAPARMFAYEHPKAFGRLVDRLVENSVAYLAKQFEAGVDAVQLFDTWAGVLPPEEFARWCIEPAARIVEGLRAKVPNARVIGFPRGAGHLLAIMWTACRSMPSASTGPPIANSFASGCRAASRFRAISIRWRCSPAATRSIDRSMRSCSDFRDGRFIFNLGHGILPPTPIAHVEQMLKRVRGQIATRCTYVVKAFHVIAVISWMAGMLYLPRLFVYHCEAEVGSKQSETFKVMERRLLRLIINPAMILTWVLGLWLVWLGNWHTAGWMHAKFALVIVLSGPARLAGALLAGFRRGPEYPKPEILSNYQ